MSGRKLLGPGNGLIRPDGEPGEPSEFTRLPISLPRQDEDPGLRDYWLIVQKRLWVAASFLVVVLTLAALASFRMTPKYESVGRIAVNREDAEMLGFKDIGASSIEDWDYTVPLETQAQILRGDELALQVIYALKLDRNPAFSTEIAKRRQEAAAGPLATQGLEVQDEAALLKVFRKNLTVENIPKTRLLEVRFLSPAPELSAEIVNTLARLYLERNFTMKYEAASKTSEWLAKQLSDLQMQVESSEERLVKYQRASDIVGIDEKQNIITSKLNDLNQQLTLAETERIQKQATFELIQAGGAESLPRVSDNLLIQRLREQEATLATQHAQARTQWGPAYPKVVELANQLKQVTATIEGELQKIAARTRNEYLAALERERMLRAAFQEQKREANLLSERSIQYAILKREVDAGRTLYEGLLQKMKEAGISAGLRSSNIRIVEPARVPAKPTKPNIPLIMGLAFVVGLAGGVGLVFFLEAMDTTIHDPEQIASMTALPSIGLIPLKAHENGSRPKGQAIVPSRNGKRGQSHPLFVLSDPSSEMAEAFRALRTSILLSTAEEPPKVILFTSALPQEGKTTVSCNQAVLMAQRGARVLLVDADLRRPAVHRAFGISATVGLSSVLSGHRSPEHAIVPAPNVPNLFILPAGPVPPQPAELLGSRAMKAWLQKWRTEYDHVIIDSPPVLAVTDAVLLSVEAEAVMLVVRAGRTPKKSLRRSCELLMQAGGKVMGVVVNGINPRSSNYYTYGYYYRYSAEDKENTETLVDS